MWELSSLVTQRGAHVGAVVSFDSRYTLPLGTVQYWCRRVLTFSILCLVITQAKRVIAWRGTEARFLDLQYAGWLSTSHSSEQLTNRQSYICVISVSSQGR